jgi:hypothetical protein
MGISQCWAVLSFSQEPLVPVPHRNDSENSVRAWFQVTQTRASGKLQVNLPLAVVLVTF